MNHTEFEQRLEIARGTLREGIGAEFMRLQVELQLHPLLVLQLAAQALGGVYRDIAEAHLSRSCECGWRPDLDHDVSLLRGALGGGPVVTSDDFQYMPTIGRA